MPFEDQDRQSDPGLQPGTIIGGRFRIESKLGEGGMGAVYRAVNATTGRAVALKAMHPEYAAKKDVVRRFMREAKAATAIRHPNIIEILDVIETDEGEPVIVMELLDGEELDAYMTRTGPLALGEVARIMTPVLSAVGAAHALGIIHRDLKPENIFLSHRSDGSRVPKVLDFGIAKVLDPNQINEIATKSGATRTGSMLGTPHYMSIEQACGEKDIDHRTDIWSLGVILYSMLSGRRPYEGENYGQILKALMTTTPPPIESLVPGLPGDVVDIVNRCTARTRDERPLDLREVYAVLSRYTQESGVKAPPSVAGSLLAHSEMVSSETLQASSVYVSRPGGGTLTKPAARRLPVLVGVVALFLLGGGGIGVAVILRSAPVEAVADIANASAKSGESATPTASATRESAVEVLGSAVAPQQDVSVASGSPLPVHSNGSPAHTSTTTQRPPPSSTTKQPKSTATEPPGEPPKSTGGGIIETLPY